MDHTPGSPAWREQHIRSADRILELADGLVHWQLPDDQPFNTGPAAALAVLAQAHYLAAAIAAAIATASAEPAASQCNCISIDVTAPGMPPNYQIQPSPAGCPMHGATVRWQSMPYLRPSS